jgi:TetR/AcrR family transcriptional regulator, mexJK operon transcriptional repressor
MSPRNDPKNRPKRRSALKSEAITVAATKLFLRDGYRSTSMDQVAADASVSKQTVYKHFADKEQLFRAIVLGVTANSEAIIGELTSILGEDEVETAADLREALERFANRYIELVLEPNVLSLRRLVIAEAERFPDLARAYYEQAPARGIEVIAAAFRSFASRGLLTFEDAKLAAAHFAYLTLGIPQDKAQFRPDERPSAADRKHLAEEAVRVFLVAYSRDR